MRFHQLIMLRPNRNPQQTHFTAKQEKRVAMHQVALEVDTFFVEPLLTFTAAQHFILPLSIFATVTVNTLLVLAVV